MSIELYHIVKRFGRQLVLDDVSFKVGVGEIVGFLGPNGAGKSTTMRIITDYLKPDAGEVRICGQSIEEQPLAIRRRLGYLAESNPLYYDMYVREFLYFVAGVYGLPNKRAAVERIIHRTGLEPEAHKKIGQLSKGYKQRVGLAQALIHDPEVLILDEPTSGLDPVQVIEIRNLIRELGKEKTVLFSSHIIQEVNALCDRVVIIQSGKIIVDKPIDELRQRIRTEPCLVLHVGRPIDIGYLQSLEAVHRIEEVRPMHYFIYHSEHTDPQKPIIEWLHRQGGEILQFSKSESDLEAVVRSFLRKGSNN